MSSIFFRAPLALLVVAPLLLGTGAAHAVNHNVIASACDATHPNSTVPARSWGVSNPSDGLLQVSCPMPQGMGAVSIYQIYANVAPGLTMSCTLRHVHKQDGSLLHMFSFGITGNSLPYLLVPPTARSTNAVAELQCMLPSKNRGRIHAIEAFSMN